MAELTIYDRIKAMEASVKMAKDIHETASTSADVINTAKTIFDWLTTK